MQTANTECGAYEITKGVLQLLNDYNCPGLTELVLPNGRRADVFAIGPAGEIIIVEVKSSLPDFLSDQKWQDYLPYCDHFYFAVSAAFPTERLPAETGLMIADQFGGSIVREALAQKLPSTRRKALTLRFARLAASRLMTCLDRRGPNT